MSTTSFKASWTAYWDVWADYSTTAVTTLVSSDLEASAIVFSAALVSSSLGAFTGVSLCTTVGAIFTGAGSAASPDPPSDFSVGAGCSFAIFWASSEPSSSYSVGVSGWAAACSVAGSSIGGATGTGFGWTTGILATSTAVLTIFSSAFTAYFAALIVFWAVTIAF